MSQLPAVEQNYIWARTPEQLSNEAKWVWQYLADNSTTQYSTETGATDISAAMGGSLTPAEVSTALTELNEKDLVSPASFGVESPNLPA